MQKTPKQVLQGQSPKLNESTVLALPKDGELEMLRKQREDHATYYGVMIWVTMMLEQWLRTHDS